MDVVASLPGLLKNVAERGKRTTKEGNQNDDRQRVELLSAARELVSALESPIEKLLRMVYLEVSWTC